jgi:hypothetical protein
MDTNVLVAAGFNPRSASARIIEEVRSGELRLILERSGPSGNAIRAEPDPAIVVEQGGRTLPG